MRNFKGKLFVLSGPSGSGKTTLYKKLLKIESLHLFRSVSCTTRKPREKEVHGKDYFFINKADFKRLKSAGNFLETEKVFDACYGTPKEYVLDLLKGGKNVLLCIDVKGAMVVKKKLPKAILIFIDVPSLDHLARRLEKRSTENKRSKALRLKVAKQELRYKKYYQHVVVNDSLEDAFKELKAIIKNNINTRLHKKRRK